MTKTTQISARNAEIRAKLIEFGESENPLTAEQETELKTLQSELKSNELKLQALYLAQADDDAAKKTDGGESKAKEKVVENANFGELVKAQLEGKEPTGAILELQQESKLRADQVPWEMLTPRGQYAEFADANTSLPSSIEVDANARPILSRVLTDGGARWMGVTFVDTRGGDIVAPIINSGSGFTVAARHAGVDSVAAGITSKSGQATRMTGNYLLAIEDIARLPEMSMTIQNDLRMSMQTKVDQIVFKDAKAATQQDAGFGATTGGLTAPTKPSANSYAELVKALPDLNKYANMFSHIKLLVGYDLAKLMKSTVNTQGSSAWEFATDMGYQIMASEHVPDTASNLVQGFYSRAIGLAGSAIFCFFGAPSLTIDQVSKMQKGQIRITLNALFDWIRVRDDNWGRWGGNNA